MPSSLRTHTLTHLPEFMDRRLFIHIQGGRQVSGILRGFDMFLNLVVDQAYEELGAGQRKPAGMVVSAVFFRLVPALTPPPPGHPRQLGHVDGAARQHAAMSEM